MEERRITILYGSQTGTAQEVAERIWRESKRFHWAGPIQPMDHFNAADLPNERLIIFVCSTTGQGEEPDNMKKFWSLLLRKNIPPNLLSNVSIAVLGLGDSSYLKFNFVSKRLSKRLVQLGASSVVPLGLADEQHDLGLDATIDPWISDLWEKLASLYPLPSPLQPIDESHISPPRYRVRISSHKPASAPASEINSLTSDGHLVYKAKMLQNARTTAVSHFQDVRLLSFSLPGVEYKPGDVLMVQPQNLEENVNKFLELLKVNGKDYIEIDPCEDKYSLPPPPSWLFPQPCTVAECVSCLLDLQSAPQRYTLQLMAHFTSSELERERLQEFCSSTGQQDLFDYCHRQRRTVLEVLQDFPHATAALPVSYLFDLFKHIRPRAFSIASASEMTPGQIELLVAVVKYRSRLVAPRLGLCSNWMTRLQPDDFISVWIRGGSFKFPQDPMVPLILIGPGTGCAPFRSLIQQRATLHPHVKGKILFFFGCRNREGDWHCRNEWNEYIDDNLLAMFCAFSRDQPDKIYVQHKITEQCDAVWDFLSGQQAWVFVAGSSKDMPAAVRDAIVRVAEDVGRLNHEQAERFVQNLERCGRYQTETWS